MAISLVGSNWNTESGADPWVQDTSLAVEAGDLILVGALIAVFESADRFGAGGFTLNVASTATTSAFTTLVNNTAPWPEVQGAWGFALATSAGNVVVSADMDGPRSGRMAVAVLRGSALFDVFPSVGAVTRGTGTSPAAASVAPTKAGDAILSLMWHSSTNSTITGSPGFTQIVKANSPNVGATDMGLLAEFFQATDTTSIAGAPTVSTSVTWAALNLVLSMKPEAILGKTIARGLYL